MSLSHRLDIAFFGSSLVSAYWNGAATYYRGIVRALVFRGHRVTFYEPDAYDRQRHRDIPDPPWAKVVVYPATSEGVMRAIASARGADLLVKASGVGVFDDLLERAVIAERRPGSRAVFWDVDAPATLDRLRGDPDDPFRALLPQFDLVFTYGGGPPVVSAYRALGARACVPIYNALDPDVHHAVPADPRFAADLSFLGNRLPDREARVDRFFFAAAAAAPGKRFLLGGSGWDDRAVPPNVTRVGHVYTADHNAFNASARTVLNVSRESMARYGYSPATRVFEAAGAGACLITDAWEGVGEFLEPGREVLVAADGDEVAAHVERVTAGEARAIGERARRRVMAEHTYAHRAIDVEQALGVERASSRRARTAPVDPGPLRIAILGLSITSSWGNGHATTYRALVRELTRRGHQVLFLERDAPWYAGHRDLPAPPYGTTELYQTVDELRDRFGAELAGADVVLLGSFVPDGAAIGSWLVEGARGVTAFYDIDTPVTLARLARGTHDYLSPALVPRFDLYFSFTGGPTLRRIARVYGARRPVALYCSVDPEIYRPTGAEPFAELGYMGTYSADRQAALTTLLVEPARLCPDLAFAVAGPLYPETIQWPGNVRRIEHVAPPEHPDFYSGLRFALNITRSDMVRAGFSPSVRLFEAAACGTPILTDAWPGLDAFFELDREIVIVRSAGDVIDRLRRTGEEERRRIGERARTAVLARHTAAHRAAELERHVAEAREARARTRLGRVAGRP